MFSLTADTDVSELGLGRLGLTVTFTETDVLLKDRRVSGSIEWGDGSPAEAISQATITQESVTFDFERSVAVGTHTIIVRGQNYRYPNPDTDTVILVVERTRGGDVVSPASKRVVSTGVILPRDVGSPNTQQWQFDIGTNSLNVESGVKLLLSTQKGERLHQPEFGTNLSRFIFEPNDSTLASLVREDINQAVEQFAPFVAIQSIKIARDTSRKMMSVEVRFINQSMGQQLSQVNLSFER